LALQIVREQLGGTLSRMLLSAYILGGPAIFSMLAPSQLAVFSAANQIQKVANNTVAFLPPTFVHWVGSAEPGTNDVESLAASCFSARANSILSVLGLLLLAGGSAAFGTMGGLAAWTVVQGTLLS
jgi:hypothetical protein